ncbi:MAG: pyridoxal phosphate-dependent aminotransferase [Lachnospiraceae bacterium]|nr:pyridoxal phosphate-dependent aminotransferase [Lachnospiraceae bacterium]
MGYDFDTPVNRRGTNSLKWDVKENELPMWVADMDFVAAPEILEAIAARAAHGVYGYSVLPDMWYQAYIDWWESRHAFAIQKDWMMFCTGVVAAISSIVRKLTTPAEKVLIQTPVYNIFFNCILNNGRVVQENPLLYDGAEYQIDFEDLENKLADPQTTLMILCNPHNPIGKIWDRETLARIGDLCKKHHVVVISDEIHCDLTSPGCDYIPFASVSETCRENSITCIAPTKTFNLAGLHTSAVVIPNEVLRHKVWRGLNTDEVAEPNAFAIDATVAAFTKGAPWLDALREYIQGNKDTVVQYVAEHIPGVHVVPSEATYLLWLDCGAWLDSMVNRRSSISDVISDLWDGSGWNIAQYIRNKTGLYLSSGNQYGGNGERFLRMNLACPRAYVQEGMKRLEEALGSVTK